MSSRAEKLLAGHKFELAALFTVLVIAAIAHGWNMFNFPYYENDEGVYVSQAWSLLTQGKLAPYTYWYDHAPAGWMLIAIWSVLTGGFFTFGFSLNSGRVLMLILHLGSSIFLYLITRKLTKSRFASLLSVLIFSLSPLGIYFQRRVLLDNIMTFWLLLSITFLLYYRNRLLNIVLSGVALGIAILTKENAIFFIPLMLYWIHLETHRKHRNFALTQWILIVGSIVSLYFIYAFVKGEFFPSGTFLGGSKEHVSLLETMRYQSSRSGGGILDLQKSSFWKNFYIWAKEDWLVMYLGFVSVLINTVLGFKDRAARFTSLLALSFCLFLMRGGLVIEFYVIPLIPLLALNLSSALIKVTKIIKTFSTNPWVTYGFNTLALIFIVQQLLISSTHTRDKLNLYTANQTKPQIAAINWIKENLDPQDFIIIDNYAYMDLRKDENKSFTNADWYWKVDTDRDVLELKLKNNPENVDYLAVTPQMENDIANNGLKLVGKAWSESKPVTRFWNDGWGVSVWGTMYPNRMLKISWKSDKKTFVDKGRINDPQGFVHYSTSQLQADMMLRAVLIDDRETFDDIFNWTKQNLQLPNGLFASAWQSEKIANDTTNSGADTEIAFALTLASKKWRTSDYQQEAKRIIIAIRNNEIATIDNTKIIMSSNLSDRKDEVVLNPSGLIPSAYKLFSQIDSEFPWAEIVDSSYRYLELCTRQGLDKTIGVLPPEGCAIDKMTKSVRQANFPPSKQTEYASKSIRTPINVAFDYRLFNDNRAKQYLLSLTTFKENWDKNHLINTVYKHDGSIAEDYESVRAYSAAMMALMVQDPSTASEVYRTKIREKFYEDSKQSYWEDPENINTQNITWFGTALYSSSLFTTSR